MKPKFQLLSFRFAKNEFMNLEISKEKSKNFETFSIFFQILNFLSFQSISKKSPTTKMGRYISSF
jgi:hypothetical protein